jgi:hypothetical protein
MCLTLSSSIINTTGRSRKKKLINDDLRRRDDLGGLYGTFTPFRFLAFSPDLLQLSFYPKCSPALEPSFRQVLVIFSTQSAGRPGINESPTINEHCHNPF